jgi:hypothetical protein
MMSKMQWIASPPPDVGYILPGANDDRVELAHPGTTPIAL